MAFQQFLKTVFVIPFMASTIAFAGATKKSTPVPPQAPNVGPVIVPQIDLNALSSRLKCEDDTCRYYPKFITVSGMSDYVTVVTVKVMKNEIYNKIFTAPDGASVIFSHEDPAQLIRLAKAFIAEDHLPIFEPSSQNNSILLKIRVLRVDSSYTNDFGYSLSGQYQKDRPKNNIDAGSFGSGLVNFMFTPISSVLFNLGLNQASEKGFASSTQAWVRPVSSGQDLSYSDDIPKFRTDNSYDNQQFSAGISTGGKVYVDANGVVRLSGLNVYYSIPQDSEIQTSMPTANSPVERISSGTVNIEMPLGSAQIIYGNEYTFASQKKGAKGWILASSRSKNTRKYSIYIVVEALSAQNTATAVESQQNPLLPESQLALLPQYTTDLQRNFFNSAKVKLVKLGLPGTGKKASMKLDMNFLDNKTANAAVSLSVKMLGTKDGWLEKQTIHKGQSYGLGLDFQLLDQENICHILKDCSVMKYLVRIGLSPQLYSAESMATEGYYLLSYVPSADITELDSISIEQAKSYDNEFVSLHRSALKGKK